MRCAASRSAWWASSMTKAHCSPDREARAAVHGGLRVVGRRHVRGGLAEAGFRHCLPEPGGEQRPRDSLAEEDDLDADCPPRFDELGAEHRFSIAPTCLDHDDALAPGTSR